MSIHYRVFQLTTIQDHVRKVDNDLTWHTPARIGVGDAQAMRHTFETSPRFTPPTKPWELSGMSAGLSM